MTYKRQVSVGVQTRRNGIENARENAQAWKSIGKKGHWLEKFELLTSYVRDLNLRFHHFGPPLDNKMEDS